jgi:hypothetical protein
MKSKPLKRKEMDAWGEDGWKPVFTDANWGQKGQSPIEDTPSSFCRFVSRFPGFPLAAAMDVASQIPVVEGGPAKRGEPHELVPGGPGS